LFKYLACPDLHDSPDWPEVSESNVLAIIKAAEERQVDAILLPGDLTDRPMYASDKGGFTALFGRIERMTAVCQVAAISGTRSHDPPGVYRALERAGLWHLKPGIRYGFFKGKGIRLWGEGAECMLFGIPEISKEYIQANEPSMSADAATARALQEIEKFIVEKIAPQRAEFPNIPAIGLLHGNVSDFSKDFTLDPILKASDIVIKTDTLALAGLDRWELGHIHTPWESKKINAGYAGFAGMDRNPWGKTGFVPSFHYVEVDGHDIKIERIPYGTPARIKITTPLEKYDPMVAYWLDSENPADIIPSGHPWSRITYSEKSAVSRRVSSDDLEKAATLPELAKLFNAEIRSDVIEKLKDIETKIKKPATIVRNVCVTYVEVVGAKFWQGRKASINISALPFGLTQLAGANGSGKSSLAGFCTPYPCFIGKDTESGRPSAIKDFFMSQESGIKKTVIFNGVQHEHLITIKGAHTKSPKVECYLSIGGVPQLDKGTFDDMLSACEFLYGPISDYLMTSFYVQPLQGKAESGLMAASMSTVRNLVQNIAGIDRTPEKDYSLAQVRECEGKITSLGYLIEAEKKTAKNKTELETKKNNVEETLAYIRRDEFSQAQANERTLANELLDKKQKLESIKERKNEKNNISTKLLSERAALAEAKSAQVSVESFSTEYNKITMDILSVEEKRRQSIIEQQAANFAKEENQKRLLEFSKKKEEFQSEVARRATRKNELVREMRALDVEHEKKHAKKMDEWRAEERKRRESELSNAGKQNEINILKKACPQCGYIPSESLARIAQLESEIVPIDKETPQPMPEPIVYPEGIVSGISAASQELVFGEKEPELIPEVFFTHPEIYDGAIAGFNKKLQGIISEKAKAESLVSSIPGISERIADCEKRISAMPDEDEIDISEIEKRHKESEKAVSEIGDTMSRLSAQVISLSAEILEAGRKQEEISKLELDAEKKSEELKDWQEIDSMLSPNKLPAMELEVFLDAIDGEATRCVSLYRSGRYSFKTITQKGDVDKFDILIHDAETGSERSFLQYSVGEKSFFNDAYVKALVRIRHSRMKTSFSPIILDEADSFIEIPMIPQFYEVQKNYYAQEVARVLVITHSPDAGNYIDNAISMKEVVE
jgi:hypothetical protein